MRFETIFGLICAGIVALSYVFILGRMGKRLGPVGLYAGLPASLVALNLSGFILQNVIHDRLFLFLVVYGIGFATVFGFHRVDQALQQKKLNPQPLYFNGPKEEVFGALLDVLGTSGFPSPQKMDQERGFIYNTRNWTENYPNGKKRELSLTCTAVIMQEGNLTKAQINWSPGTHFVEISNPTVFRLIDSITEHFITSVRTGGISNIGV